MEVKIKSNNEMIDDTIEMVDGVMVVSPKEMKFEPKDGDVCYSLNCIYIFKGVRQSKVFNTESTIVYHCCYNGIYLTVTEDVGVGYISRNQRYATEEEKQKLFDKLAEEGLAWDAEKKELVKLKWKPKDGERYYFPFYSNCHFLSYYADVIKTDYQNALYQKCWVFKTDRECIEFCNRLNEAINSVEP